MQPHIVAIFVVHFDVTKGNVVAWQHPQGKKKKKKNDDLGLNHLL